MSAMAVLTNGYSLNPSKPTSTPINRHVKYGSSFSFPRRYSFDNISSISTSRLFRSSSLRLRCIRKDVDHYEAPRPKDNAEEEDNVSESFVDKNTEGANWESSLLAKLAVVLGIVAIFTVISIRLKPPGLGSLLGVQRIAEGSSSSLTVASSASFTFKAFGYNFVLPQYAPGWVYFWLLMAAACGLFISEEALNIWVGISLARMLSLDGTWPSFVESLSRNAPYIISTVFWVYWGVCISDMIPYYLGKLFKQSGASDDVCSKLGIDREKALNITRAVKKYGNLIGVVERLSIGVRNPTAFLAGALGISPERFFAGVCFGGLITLPLQLAIGFLLRERPIFALVTVATAVGIWTIFPYAVAASTALFLFLRRRYSS